MTAIRTIAPGAKGDFISATYLRRRGILLPLAVSRYLHAARTSPWTHVRNRYNRNAEALSRRIKE